MEWWGIVAKDSIGISVVKYNCKQYFLEDKIFFEDITYGMT